LTEVNRVAGEELARVVLGAIDDRQLGDYGSKVVPTAEQARNEIRRPSRQVEAIVT